MTLTMIQVQNEQVRTAHVRLGMLGEELQNLTQYNVKDSAKLFRDRAKLTCVHRKYLFTCWQDYRDYGIDGLVPDWPNPTETNWDKALEMRQKLGDLADAPVIDRYQIKALAEQNGWTEQRARYWLTRYRIGGLWALAPGNDPTRPRKKQKPAIFVALGALTGDDIVEINRKLDLLGPEIESKVRKKEPITEALIEARAAEVGRSPRQLRYYISNLKQFGEPGLARKTRSDQGRHHYISKRMEKIIIGIRESYKDYSIPNVYREAVKRALLLREVPPGEWVVRDIIDDISKGELALADGRESDFRSGSIITYKREYRLLIYAGDIKEPLDVLAQDLRPPGLRNASGEVRAYKFVIIDLASRVVPAFGFSYLRPDETFIAGVIRDALIVSDKGVGGVPKELWVDNGKPLKSEYIKLVARRAQFDLHVGKPRNPTERAILERFFEKVDQELWSTLEGYVGRNVVERNPTVKAKYTVAELEQKFREYLDGYHNTKHDELGMTPLEFWYENCFPESLDPELGAILLDRVQGRTIGREGIKYDNNIYWHSALGPHVGKPVIIRFKPGYDMPQEIEVYLSIDGSEQWLCTAFNRKSERGKAVTPDEIREAQTRQRQAYKDHIAEARDYLSDIDAEVEGRQQESTPPTPPPSSPTSDPGSLLGFNDVEL